MIVITIIYMIQRYNILVNNGDTSISTSVNTLNQHRFEFVTNKPSIGGYEFRLAWDIFDMNTF